MPPKKTRHSTEYREDLKKFPRRNGRSFHHFHYKHLRHRQSIYWLDGMYIPDWLHVPIIHKILGGGGGGAGNQTFGRFPNVVQRVAHWVCRAVFVVF